MDKNKLVLASGFAFDYQNMVGEGKVTTADIEAIQDKIDAAQEAIRTMRKDGVIRGHLSKDGEPERVLFSQLPYIAEGNLNSPDSIKRLLDFGEALKESTDAVISFGIGGSYLGNRVLYDVQCGAYWNSMTKEERGGYPKLYFSGNNLDPRSTEELLAEILRNARKAKAHGSENYRVKLVVISKSGSTLDTMATFMILYTALCQAEGISVSVTAVTDPNEEKPTLLKKLATEQGWDTFSVPDGVGGRFSIFSEVGLITAACIGFDIEAFLAGARAMDEACQTDSVTDNPALLNAVLKYIAAETYGRDIEVFMPYADNLKSTAEWYIQLLAESLGKRLDRNGETVFYGRTPIVAVGTTDMHAQTQQHQDGKHNKVVQFLEVGQWESDPMIPDAFPSAPKLSDISGLPISAALQAALESNAQALAGDNRMNAVFHLPKLNAYHLGELLYLLALSIAYEGELADVDAFDQPGVEGYKRILGPLMQQKKAQQ